MQMLFGNGAAPDPMVLEQLLAMGFGGLPGQFAQPQQQDDPSKPKHHPTAASTLRNLPRVKVTAHDIEANEGPYCSISLEEFVIGEQAVRLPCGHMFNEECILDWLKKSNECPVCRYELPTEDKEHEKGRAERMKGRKIRLRMSDLTVKSVQELTRLAHFINVDCRGCIEKKEIVERIAASKGVEIILAEGEELPSAPSESDRLPRSSWLSSCDGFYGGAAASGGANASQADTPAAAPVAAPAAAQLAAAAVSPDDLPGKSISELRKIASEVGASLDGCLEKSDIVERIASRLRAA
jgi:hypothetical protein